MLLQTSILMVARGGAFLELTLVTHQSKAEDVGPSDPDRHHLYNAASILYRYIGLTTRDYRKYSAGHRTAGINAGILSFLKGIEGIAT